MNKKILIIGVGVLVIIGLITYFYFAQRKSLNTSTEPTVNQPTNPESTSSITATPLEIGRVLFPKAINNTAIRYLDRDGLFYEYTLANKAKKSITNKAISLPESVIWSPNGQKVLVQTSMKSAEFFLIDFTAKTTVKIKGSLPSWINETDYAYTTQKNNQTLVQIHSDQANDTTLKTFTLPVEDLKASDSTIYTLVEDETASEIAPLQLIAINKSTKAETLVAKQVSRIFTTTSNSVIYSGFTDDGILKVFFYDLMKKSIIPTTITPSIKSVGSVIENDFILTLPQQNSNDKLILITNTGQVKKAFDLPENSGPFFFTGLTPLSKTSLIGSVDGLLYQITVE